LLKRRRPLDCRHLFINKAAPIVVSIIQQQYSRSAAAAIWYYSTKEQMFDVIDG
jgi:hypothetical protein